MWTKERILAESETIHTLIETLKKYTKLNAEEVEQRGRKTRHTYDVKIEKPLGSKSRGESIQSTTQESDLSKGLETTFKTNL